LSRGAVAAVGIYSGAVRRPQAVRLPVSAHAPCSTPIALRSGDYLSSFSGVLPIVWIT